MFLCMKLGFFSSFLCCSVCKPLHPQIVAHSHYDKPHAVLTRPVFWIPDVVVVAGVQGDTPCIIPRVSVYKYAVWRQ